MQIDIHAHCWPDAYLDLLVSNGSGYTEPARAMRAGDDDAAVSARLTAMDRAGLDLQVVSVLSQAPYHPDVDRATIAARLANDHLVRLVRAHPDRLGAFGVLPLPHLDAAVTEAARVLDDGLAGVAVTGTILGRTLADPEFLPLLAELDQRGAVLFVHPTGSGCGPHVDDHGLGWVIGAPLEDTITAVHLVRAGIPARFRNLQVIVCHLGGALPALLNRIDDKLGPAQDGTLPSDQFRRLWYDTVDHGSVPALSCAVQTLGAGRLLLGTDYPFTTGTALDRCVSHIRRAELADTETARITGGNALGLLRGTRLPIPQAIRD